MQVPLISIDIDVLICQVMQETLEFMRDKWGSVNGYLNDIGFSYAEQTQLGNKLRKGTE